MRTRVTLSLALALAVGFPALARAQDPAGPPNVTTSVPRLITLTGTYQPASGQPAGIGAVLTLAVYAEPTGGTPLFQETQQVALDGHGGYVVQLGATSPDGLPRTLFADGQERWLGAHFAGPGETERPRTRLTSVPYALRAADADTLAGRPASAYALAPADGNAASMTHATAGTPATTPASTVPALVQSGTTNFLAKYVTTADVGNSSVVETGGQVGVGTAAPLDFLHVRFTNASGTMTGYAVQNLGNTPTSYSGMLFYDQFGALGQFQGFGNVTHEYRINNIARNATGYDGAINFMIGGISRLLIGSTGDVTMPGALLKGGVPFLRAIGDNTYLGLSAGGSGARNVAVGYQALSSNTIGGYNAAYGAHALLDNTQGNFNVAIGGLALETNQTGNSNIAVGVGALEFTSAANGNVAVGDSALEHASGANNVGVGFLAGRDQGAGSNNIYLGAQVFGQPGDSNTMYLGAVGTQTRAFLAGVRGVTTGAADAVPVVIDSAGQLGTVNSSRRYKEDIRDVADASSGLMQLRPVTFRYRQPFVDGRQPLDYGLIAEEVEDVYPDLVAHLADGQVETVQYQKINAMLLNEVQKQYRTLQQLRGHVDTQATEIALLKARLAALETRRH